MNFSRNFPKHVRIVEVSPRDGLQNEPITIPTQTKIELIHQLSATGLTTIETTSFVSPRKIPQLADGAEVLQGISKSPHIQYPVLVPNLTGFEHALEAGAKSVAVFTAVSETFSQKNTNCSIEESFERIEQLMPVAKQKNIFVRGYISCVLGCPYEGPMPVSKTVELCKRLIQLGINEISLGDTIGVGTPLKAQQLVEAVAKEVPINKIAVHFHNTYGQALANIYACLEVGVSIIDSSVAGLGGCPYAKGATGNVATEDVVYMLNGLDIKTGVDLNKLIDVTRFVVEFTRKPPRSKVGEAMLK